MKTFFYVGTYTQPIRFGTGEVLEGKGLGIYCVSLDHSAGAARVEHVNTSVPNPSFLCCLPGREVLWAVSELKDYGGMVSGAVSALRVDRNTRELTLINTVPTMGADPCYVSMEPESGLLFTANYSSGSLTVFPVNEDGSLCPHSQVIRRAGSGPDAGRQEGPHIHCAVPLPGLKRVMACDLGTDRICEYPVSPGVPRLFADQATEIAVAPGSGPRHIAVSDDRSACYVTMELSSEILVLVREKSGWTPIQTVASYCKARSGGSEPANLCADIHLSPDGRFLYCSNRGRDCISAFLVGPDRTLSHLADYPANGRTPRSFCLDPAGDYLLCANQDSDSVSVFCLNRDDGSLTPRGMLDIPTPVNVLALPQFS